MCLVVSVVSAYSLFTNYWTRVTLNVHQQNKKKILNGFGWYFSCEDDNIQDPSCLHMTSTLFHSKPPSLPLPIPTNKLLHQWHNVPPYSTACKHMDSVLSNNSSWRNVLHVRDSWGKLSVEGTTTPTHTHTDTRVRSCTHMDREKLLLGVSEKVVKKTIQADGCFVWQANRSPTNKFKNKNLEGGIFWQKQAVNQAVTFKRTSN